ncbi:hypothetical protein EIP91_000456 [Steccherinum ochraceum]|uniref:Alpha-galactosidase n=1 Tax=Steccherinum ochraceum TaxID=92696 RepID=A0A4R0RI40_9APHY|nr:hypothetical protein EIP91_000456 [Steccherinum ochraceum]
MSFLSEAMRYDLLVVQTAAVAAIAQAGAWAQCLSGVGDCHVCSSTPALTAHTAHAFTHQNLDITTPALGNVAAAAPTAGPSKKTGKTPALGWNSWNAYRCNISETRLLAAANDMVSLGLKDAGYEYVNIDDCWSEMIRDPTTKRIVPDSVKFPNGISGAADQIHDLGLKIGIYSDAGTMTCAGYPGSLEFEDIDAATFNDWGIDCELTKYSQPEEVTEKAVIDLKYDNCNVPSNWTDTETPPHDNWYLSNSAIRFRQMAGALAAQTTHPIQLDLCIWGTAHVWDWGAKVGHSWRMAGDSTPDWNYIKSIISFNAQHLDAVDFFSHNDMDMMEIGNGNLTIEEQRTHFAAWCFMKSPILLGTDLGLLSASQIQIITNSELLAFSQDTTIGTPATILGKNTTDPPEFFSGTSEKGAHVFIVNTANSTETKRFAFDSVPGLSDAKRKASSFVVHDMWTGKDVGTFRASGEFSVAVAPHDTAAFLITPA